MLMAGVELPHADHDQGLLVGCWLLVAGPCVVAKTKLRIPESRRDLRLVCSFTTHDTTSATRRNERLPTPNGRAYLGMARSEDGRWQRVLPQCRDKCDDLGQA